jgi:hypothetical protein
METTNTKSTYASLKSKEQELLAQLKELREEITIAENGIVEEKLNTAIQCLVDVEEMTGSHYCCTIETYCEGCEETVELDVDLAEIISSLQQLR